MKRTLLLFISAVLLLAVSARPTSAFQLEDFQKHGTPVIWAAPMDPIVRPEVRGGGSKDFMQLFQEGAAWPSSSAYVQVFKLYPQFVGRASDTELSSVIAGLKRLRIMLALEVGLLQPTASCGRGIEGHDANQLALAQRIERLGGQLDYIAADEPVWFGHSLDAANACQASLGDLAKTAAHVAREFRSVFPTVKFVEIEPISNFKNPGWIDDIERFQDEFKREFGEPFAALHIDIDWNRPWQDRALTVRAYSKMKSIALGVIYNGTSRASTDEQWLAEARNNFQAYELLAGGAPDQVIFQSWMPRPTMALPETSPSAFTRVIFDYVRMRSEAKQGLQ